MNYDTTKEEIKKAIETKLNPKFLEMNIKALMATNQYISLKDFL